MAWYFTSCQCTLSHTFSMQYSTTHFVLYKKFPPPVPASGYPERVLDTHVKKIARHQCANGSYGNFSGLMPARAGRLATARCWNASVNVPWRDIGAL